MCKICEAMPLNQQYVSPYPKVKDIFDDVPLADIRTFTKILIDGIVASSKRRNEAERLDRTGQTSLY